MNREQRRASQFKRTHRDRNAAVEPSATLRPILYSRPFDEQESAQLSTEARLAWHHLTHGSGTEPHFDTLAQHLNVCRVMAEKVDPLPASIATRAQLAMQAMKERYQRLGIFGADAEALATVPEALDLYDQFLALSTPLQMTQALHTSQRVLVRQRAEAGMGSVQA
jgi:hypothetical protein